VTSFDDLVAAATVGLTQRPVRIGALAGPAAEHSTALPTDDPAAAVLAAAALLTAAQRAGQLPGSLTDLPPPAPADTAAELPAGAAAVLATAIHLGDAGLLVDLLTLASGKGFRAPVPVLPALLSAAARSEMLRPAVAAVLGQRGSWLAAQRPHWRSIGELADPRAPAGDDEPAPEGDGTGVWETGTRGQRRGYLERLRQRDPAGARELLRAGWARETGEDREVLVGVLEVGLSLADEAFLESALDDRKASVREEARRLLAALPRSAFTARAAARGERLLRVERKGLRRRLVVSVPGEIGGAPRDGVSSKSPVPGVGPRVWLLMQLVAATPLAVWTRRLGMEPEALVALTVADGYADNVHAGWRQAAVRERDGRWAAALLAAEPPASRPRPPAAWPPAGQLVALLPADRRVARAISLLGSGSERNPTVAEEVAGCPAPWPPELVDAVLAHLGRAQAVPQWSRVDDLLAALSRSAPPQAGYANRLRRLANGRWAAELSRAADLLDLRRRFIEELT
jgi:hypothetical protein